MMEYSVLVPCPLTLQLCAVVIAIVGMYALSYFLGLCKEHSTPCFFLKYISTFVLGCCSQVVLLVASVGASVKTSRSNTGMSRS